MTTDRTALRRRAGAPPPGTPGQRRAHAQRLRARPKAVLLAVLAVAAAVAMAAHSWWLARRDLMPPADTEQVPPPADDGLHDLRRR